LSARERIGLLADPGSFAELAADPTVGDPLDFADLLPYRDRLRVAAASTGERDAVVFGTAELHGHPVVLLAMEFGFMGGSMGAAVGEAVTVAAELAADTARTLVYVCASGGARMQEGIISLLQMAKTSQALARLHEAGVLSISVLTDPTFGGVTASFATLGSIVVAESEANVGFAGRRVITQTIRTELPRDFQTSGFLMRHGLVDRVESRDALRPQLARLIALHRTAREPAGEAARELAADPLARPYWSEGGEQPDAWDVVRASRHIGRPTTLDYLREAFDDFVELHGDRAHSDDPAIVGGVASIGGRSVVVVGHQKGHDTRELVARNFGMAHPEGYRKALRLYGHAERFGLPVVTLIDTPGAYPGVQAEERGQSNAIAELIMRSSQLRVPVVSVITGEGGSGGALALGTGDLLLMLANSTYSVISPEGCAAILWRDGTHAPDAARALRVTAADLVELGVADGVVPEPPGGAQADPAAAAQALRRAVLAALDRLAGLTPAELARARYDRFRATGRERALAQAASR
jgi:acetyl-CoA carboxylase carboxyl transferase subunit beta